VTFVQRLRWLVILAGFCAACATLPTPVTSETQEQAWHRARVVEAMVNGCAASCPADVNCVDEYGLCWTPCAWKQMGADLATRRSVQAAAVANDPKSAFFMECHRPPGTVQAAFTQR
jgi:hypothetical protein